MATPKDNKADPKPDAHKAPEPKVVEPKVDASTGSEARLDDAKALESAADPPKVDDPKPDAHKAPEPKVVESKVEPPKASRPSAPTHVRVRARNPKLRGFNLRGYPLNAEGVELALADLPPGELEQFRAEPCAVVELFTPEG